MTPRGRLALLIAGVVAGIVVLVLLALGGGGEQPGPRRLAPGRGSTDTTRDPLGWSSDRSAQFEARAAAGLAHVLYAKSPGGVVATAARVARLDPLIADVARRAHQDAGTLEAIVFLESAGRPDARASDDLSSAVGLTQILAQTATGLLGLKVDVPASQRLTRRIERGGLSARRLRALVARRRRVDERFDPRKALEATTRYLEFARARLGRDDLAVESYHMGVGNLQRALSAYGGDPKIPYAQLFFDSTPLRHPGAWRVLSALGDDSSTYYWRILAAKAIMSTYRDDPRKLARMAQLQVGPSAEHVLRPPGSTPRFADGGALKTDELVLLEARGVRVAATLPRSRRLLRPDALKLLRYLAAGVREVSGVSPLVVTAAARTVSDESASGEGGAGVEAAPSEHTTGYAFDLSRAYRSGAQAQALQFWLDRLTALDLIAWTREPRVIHVTVGPRAAELPA